MVPWGGAKQMTWRKVYRRVMGILVDLRGHKSVVLHAHLPCGNAATVAAFSEAIRSINDIGECLD